MTTPLAEAQSAVDQQHFCKFEKTRTSLRELIWSPHRSPAHRTLYHYTTAAGLQGIIRDRCLWLSHSAYLNDETELREATRFLIEQVELAQSGAEGFASKFLLELRQALDPAEPEALEPIGHAFVGCFSTDGDSLTQWRAYGRGEGGFAVGFSADSIWKHQESRKQGYWLLPCMYEEGQARNLCNAAINGAIAEAEGFAERIPLRSLVQQFILAVTWYSGAIKHSSYHSENEWRLIYYRLVAESSPEKLAFMANNTFTPYVSFAFGEKADMLHAIDEIVVGPQRHMDLAKAGVQAFVALELERAIDVRKSRIPFRTLA